MLIDTHCHLTDPAFAADLGEVVARTWADGVAAVVVIGHSEVDAERAMALAAGDDRMFATAGIHPHDAGGWSPAAAAWLGEVLRHPRVVAAGEMGLDYHYDHAPRDRQRVAFTEQLALSRLAGKPAVIHAREADDDVAAVLREQPDAVAVMHSFSSGLTLHRTAVALGHYVSFSGMVTFRNWTLDDAIRDTPLDRLLLETDAPYLAPAPHRGKRNEPRFVRRVAEQLAVVLGRDVEEIIDVTGRNAKRVFGLA